MVKLQKWEKQELLKAYKQNRSQKRCEIVKGLKEKADSMVFTIDKQIKALQKERHDLLFKNNLVGFIQSNYGCNEYPLHVSLINYDKETDEQIQAIVTDTFVGMVTD